MIKEGCITKELQNSPLNPHLHEDGIIRLYGRLQNADIPDDPINPILLAIKDALSRLMIEDIHRRFLHSNHLTHSLKYEISTGYQKEEQKLRKY